MRATAHPRGSVTLWETGKTRPTGQNRAAIVALRKLGRREVARMLELKEG